jgi:hypothetical protein
LLLSVLAGPVRAQDEVPPVPFGLAVGQLHSTTAGQPRQSERMWALRLASPLVPLGVRHFLVEPGMSYGGFLESNGLPRHLFVMEVQVQFQSGTPPFQPYVGVGGGLGLTRASSHTKTKGTFSASAGVRLDVTHNLGAVGELRFRRIGFFEGWSRELTLGVYATLR